MEEINLFTIEERKLNWNPKECPLIPERSAHWSTSTRTYNFLGRERACYFASVDYRGVDGRMKQTYQAVKMELMAKKEGGAA